MVASSSAPTPARRDPRGRRDPATGSGAGTTGGGCCPSSPWPRSSRLRTRCRTRGGRRRRSRRWRPSCAPEGGARAPRLGVERLQLLPVRAHPARGASGRVGRGGRGGARGPVPERLSPRGWRVEYRAAPERCAMGTSYRLAYLIGFTPWEDQPLPPELSALVEGPRARPPGRALDLGCGRGAHAVYLASHGWNVTGVDLVPAALAKARRRATEAGVEVQFLGGDVTRLDALGMSPGLTRAAFRTDRRSARRGRAAGGRSPGTCAAPALRARRSRARRSRCRSAPR